MLRRYDTLPRAFSALEQHLDNGKMNTRQNAGSKSRKRMSLNEFAEALSFFRVSPQQAHHVFRLMDANNDGDVTLGEFRKALLDMPRSVLLQDFRRRLLTKYSSIPDAFKEISGPSETYGKQRPLDQRCFALKLLSWGVAEEEAQTLFNLIDQDSSGTISLHELREAVREVAPWISLDEFHRRFAHQWPDIARLAGKGAHSHRRGAEKLFALLSPAHLCTDLGATKELPDCLSKEAFVEMCTLIDITESNSAELFEVCATSAKWQCRRPGDDVDGSVVLLDDFFDCLHLWSENPVNHSVAQLTEKEHRRGSANDVAKHLAPVRGVLKALKGQLASFKTKQELA
jgi:Ca2+-binding EF-hand superfamily protein